MGKGPKTPDWVEQEIATIYMQGLDKGNVLQAKEVLNKLPDRLKEIRPQEKSVDDFLPSLRKVQLVLTELRGRYKPQGEDGEWSLASSANPLWMIPPEANPDLLKIWRWCQIVGRNFAIREAKWVSRLRGIVPFEYLLIDASLYAERERASNALGQPLDTTDVDAALVFRDKPDQPTGNWLYNTMVDAGAVPPYFMLAEEYPIDKAEHLWKQRILSYIGAPPGRAVAVSLEVEAGYPHRLPVPADEVYAFCLQRLAKGPNWSSLSKESRENIAKRLHSEVRAALREFESVKAEDFRAGRVGFTWKPSRELRKEVGIVEERSENIAREGTSQNVLSKAVPPPGSHLKGERE